MRLWIHRTIALLLALLGSLLIGLVWRAAYTTDHTAQTLLFKLGMPLMLLSTLAGGLLIGAAGLLFAFAKHQLVRRG
jgi:hypothetical protein